MARMYWKILIRRVVNTCKKQTTMKRILYFAALSLLAACGKHGLEEFAAPDYTFYAYTPDAQADARTYVDEALKLRWTHDDRITVFHGMLQPLQFAFMGETGSLSGTYRNVDGVFYTPDPDAPNNVAVYPYSAAHPLNADDRSVMVMMPTEQTYVADSFGLNANTMIAITSGVEDMALYFKNVGTILNVRLWGTNQTVKSITLTATGGEALSGAAKVTPIYQGEPSCAMQDTEVQPSVKLICPEAVEVNTTEDAPVSFWLVLPPVTMRQGFTATVEDAEGATQTFAITQSVTFARNKYNTLTRELAIEQETPAVQASNEIWYTTTDNQPIDLSGISGTNAFATTIAAHAYSGGKGVITFDGDVTKVAGNAFSNKSTLVSVSLPDKVTEVGTKAFY